MEKLTEETCPDFLPDWSFSVLQDPRTLLHEAIEAQADRTPDALAVAWEGERLTYRDLDQRANRLAAHLRALGVGPEVPVGVCVERSAGLIVALLATLKAGGAYVPLDPAYPVQRNAYTLDDSGARVVLTQASALASLPPLAGRRAVLLDEHAAAIAARPAARPARLCEPGNLAYFIYTSGSTGRPKGVAIEHRSVVSLMRWCADLFSSADVAGVLASTSICFDISIFEMFAPLCLGGTMIVAGNALDLPYLPPDPPVTLVSTVPSAMAELVRTRRVPPSVRVANLGGEALPGSLVEEIYRTTGIERVYNVYGPSEDTTYSTYALIPRDSRTAPPVGDPLPGTSVWLLDEEGTPVPFGQEGEVHLTGAGLSRGYFGRPELTAERFLPDPFSGEPGARMYRVGDLGRFLPDGQLHYVGRVDFQVKIRGFRVELGEVEDALMRHPAVREAAVMARGDVAEGRHLVAWLAVDGPMPEIGELRSFLGLTLPHYMIPSRFVQVDALPRTLNGKVDRKALPDPEAAAAASGVAAAPAPVWDSSRPVGETLAGIWGEVLGLAEVRPDDHFFHLGGHSLLGARVLARVRETFGVDLPVQALFQAPTVETLAGVIAAALREGGQAVAPPVRPVARHERLPLSFAQERFWFLDRLQPGSAAYNVPLALRLEGELDGAALEAALGEVARRHEALRTRFVETAGTPFQEVDPAAGLPLPRIDLAALPEASREAELVRLVRAATAGPFDLARAPLVRARLVRLGSTDHALLATFHHAVFDGWSEGAFNRELSALYAAAREGRPSPLAEPPVQYGDYAVWERSRLTRETLAGLLDWWRGELAGAPTELELPADRPRPEAQAFRGAVERMPLPAGLTAALADFARGEGATRFMALLAAFQALVWRLTGQEDFLVGSPSANRPRPELEGIVGLFLETLALRGRPGGDPPFRELLARARETALRAYAHQDLPFEHLVAGLGVERSPARSPLVQAMLSLQAAPEEGLDLSGLAARLLDPQTATSRLDLSLVVEEAGGGLRAALEYDSALFDAVTARHFLARFLTLLEGAVAGPALRLSDLPLFAAAERHQLLVEWNDTGTAAPSGPGLLRRIGERARRTPGALAVAQGNRRASFGELEAQSGRLARRLRRLGAGPETLVAVCLPRSIEAVAAFLAIWKTGAAYVPLDPSYPIERLAFVLADSGAPVLIAQGELADALARPGVQVVDPDAGEEAVEEPAAEVPADSLAYVIYTSGSTGRPKGVEVAHRSLLNLVDWHVAAYGLAPGDRSTMLARVGFDASVWEIWPALAAGASLHLPEEEALTDPERLRDWLVAEEIAVSFLPTPLAELLVGLPWPEETALRALLTGGDALRRRPTAGLPFLLVNHYGPTEATVVTTAGEVAPAEAGGDRLPPIGRPLPGVRIYVLDAGLRPLPAGVPGELVIGGAGLARGYLGAPVETAERYVPDLFSEAPGARLYRTGDLVRSRPDGEIEFLGRIDRQVKLRGFRLELGEIEAALARHPEVREAAVIVAGNRLVAFAAPRRQPAPPADEVLGSVRRELPDYMVPAALVTLPELPLSPNGKIDRNALAALAPAAPAGTAGTEAPSTPEGERIAAIWREVLGLDSVGARDDFFRLGGHSLMAAGVIARIREAFGVDLPVQALFRAPTVEGLAGAVAAALRAGGRSSRPPVVPVRRAETAADETSWTAPEPAVSADAAPGDLPTLVARIWADVLHLPAVEPRDNFFDLGGHSLLGARVLSRVRDLLGIDLPLRALFRTPTVEGLAGTLEEALRGGARPEARPLAAGAPQGERLPLSFAQERFWLLDRLERGSSVYNIPLAYALEGELDAAALEGALREVVRRHGALRTRFVEVAGSPFQEVLPPAGPELPGVDLAALPEPARRGELARLAREEAAGPFDLGQGSLLRARLVRLDAAEHVLLTTFHHAVFDGWSQGLFERELSALYAAALEGRPSPLPEPALQYTDYALWQRGWLGGGVQQQLLDWWGRELAGAPAVLALPTDRPRPEVQASRGARERLELPPALAEGMTALGRAERATRFMVALAAFQALLGALSGREDLLVGSPVANRPRPELEGLIGLFVETVVVRGRLEGDPSFRELLGRVREAALGAFAHQDLPFERLVAGLRVQRSSARNPLIQALFALEAAGAGLSLPGIAARPLAEAETATSKFDLSLFVKETASGLRAELEYDSDLFDPTTARRLLAMFSGVLAGAVADPARRLSEILPLSAGERRQIVAEEVERVGARRGPAPERAAAPALPSLDMEMELIAQVWSELLGVPEVGPDDNFFHLGGHSLVGARMLTRVRELLGVDLAIRELFRAPTVRALAERVAFLRAERPVLTAPVVKAHRGGLLPASFVQESLWFLHLLEPRSPVYNIPVAWRLRGRLDAGALEMALGAIISRHEVLRGSFVEVEGQPFLEVSPALPAVLPRIDLAGLPAAVAEGELARLTRAEAGAPFDLGAGPLLRLRLFALGAEDHVLQITLHHSVFDGASQQVLGRELAALYRAAVEGSAPRLPELPVQYADFAAWQRSWLRGGVLEGLLAFWREALAGAPMVLELPFDRPRPPVQTFRGAWEIVEVPAALGGDLLGLGRREGATSFMTLLAAFQTLLYRVTGQPDLLVGSPVANRPQAGLELLIGYFVDTVVLRGRFRGEETFRERIARVRETALDAFSHQELPFELLATGLEVERDPSRNPVFQVLFALDGPAPSLALPGLAARPLSPVEPTAKLDLSLGVLETEGALRLTLEHNLDLFDPATARRLLRGLEVLLAAVTADPGLRLDSIPLLSAAELAELTAAAERNTAGLSMRRLHDLFAAQAARAPEAPAVLAPTGEGLTYGELSRRSRRIAGFLVRRGVGPETPVGVCLERSPETVAAMLGVLEAGGVYLPLDPEYPAERLTWMLEDSGARLVLTREGLLERVPAGDWDVVSLKAVPADGEAAPEAGRALPEGLAYLIYTSGSTGRPKGVGVPHAAAAAHVEAAAELFGLDPGDRVLWFASPGFDTSVEEVLAPLSRGAAVVLRDADLWAPEDFLDHVARLGVTVVDLPTAYWHQWVAGAGRASLPAGLPLRLVVLGSEAMSGEAARRWLRSPLAGIPLLNGYGPTETVVTSTAFAVDASTGSGTVPIGRPLAGRSAWVLDGFGHPVPAGAPGELCVGGPLLARGYLGRPDLTAERFVPDPFAGRPGSRLYRTGDLARLRPDGVLEFLGRIDRQLKVRGFRVELGEVEAALARHPAVREAVVDARPDLDGQRLVAWIVPAGAAPSAADLAGFLRGALPEPMVPSAFVMIGELPLTPNGKVNLRALPAPEASAEAAEVVAPRTPTEERLAGLWRELLGSPRIGVHDSFFALGGHSLLVTRLLSRVRDAFGVEIAVRALFAAPTLEAMAALVDGARREPAVPQSRPATARRSALPPLSFSQQSLWLVERLQGAGGAYNLPAALRLGGPLDVAALAAALRRVVARHGALRTRFAVTEGEPYQEVLPAAGPDLEPVDLSALPADRREAAALALARAEAARPFELSAGPLLRARLFRLGPGDHLFLLVAHHAVSDGWSHLLILRELAAFYRTAVEGLPDPLPAPPLQFADYAVWQRRHLRGGVLASLLAHWRERLAGVPALEFPTDHRRPAVWSFRGAVRSTSLDALSGGLERLARDVEATPFMALLAGLQVLLGRHSGQSDFAVGTPTANRSRSELEEVVGFFVNMLPLRADLSGAPTFRQLLERVRATVLEAFAHQELPFELLVEELSPERDLGRNPLFQVALQLVYPEEIAFPGLAARRVELDGGTAKFDLNVAVERREGGLSLACEYAADLFEAATVQRLLDQLARLLAGAVAGPDLGIADLPLLSPAERHQVLAEWNDTEPSGPSGPSLLRRIDERARRTPEALAVAQGDRRATFGELAARAGRLALRLRRLGVGPETRVAVCLPRSIASVASFLAVWKAGGAYVPLDPSYPSERLDFMLADSGAPVLIAKGELAETLARPGVRVVDPDAGEETAGEPWEEIPADALAYIVYTSGSTGRPKGVEVSHHSLLNLVDWHVAAYGLGEADRATMLAQPGFDASVWEIWPALAAGASLHLPDEGALTDPGRLRDWLVAQGITVSFAPTPMAELLVGLPWPQETALRSLLTGGDALHHGPSAGLPFRLINHYGPTEATVVATAGEVASAETGEDRLPPIGRPLPGVRVHVLDPGLRPLPAGVPGELHIGGAGLARGYHGQAGLTAERFVPDPFAAGPGGRLYRTGDRVRRLPSGELEFLGRLDFQVKVRGFRIELGEIEARLGEHPAVRQCALAVLQTGGDKRLVAYVAAPGPGKVTEEELRSFLAARLPAYMVPASFVLLPALPLDANGKVDRRALERAARSAEERAGAAADSPRTPLEETLAAIWAAVLRVGRVGRGESFFSLGGHSLLVGAVLARVRDAFGVDLPAAALFSAPTVAALAARVEAARGVEARTASLPVRESLRERLPLSFSQRSLWLVERLQPAGSAYNLPMAVRFGGPLDAAALAAALGGVVERHEALRTRFVEVDGEPWQEVLPATVPDLSPVDLSALPADRREEAALALARAEFDRPFELSAGPLLRARLFRLGADDHLFLLVVHHAVSDGWSDQLILRNLAALYQAAVEGRPDPLPAPPLQFADYAVWQRQHLRGEVLAGLFDHWRERLAGVPALELPTDHRRPALWSFRGAVRSASLDGLSEGLERLARGVEVTPFMALLAAAQVLLGRYSGQSDFAVGTPTANRSRSELEDVVGFFVNMLPLRADLSGAPTFRQLLGRVRATALEAFAHQELPFELLVEELSPERDLGRNPVFQVVLQLLYSEESPFPGLESRHVELTGGTAKFDLNFFVERRDGRLSVACEYALDLFEPTTVQRLLDQFELLLAGAIADPDREIGDLPLLSQAERHHLLAEANDVSRAWPREATIHGLVEEAAARTPEAVAVIFEDRRLTYRELDEWAGRLAARLVALGVRPEDRVALLTERSLEMVVALLAVLKAGAAYAPIDPALPAERMAYLLADLCPPVILVQERLRSRIPHEAEVMSRVVSLDEPLAEAPLASPPFVTADSLAYVLYTSGSTGKPKGVACAHRGVVRLVRDPGYADLGPERTLLQLTALTFDPSVMEIWGPLTNGGRLVVFPPGVPTFEKLEEVIATHGVDTAWLTTGLFHQVVDERPGALAPLRQLLAGGDVLSPSHVRRAIQVPPGRVLVNGYGPTESTLFTTCQAMWSPAEVREPVSIGRPVNGTQVYVLDRGLRPAPFGVPGELYVGGDGLARGYDGRPDLTAERFVPGPFSGPFAGQPGERLYRTGDLVRMRPSGELDFLGRLDFQVKVRGFRIELGEIDATLGGHPEVRQCAVVVRQDARGDKHLVAYVAAPEPERVTAEELRSFLAAKLPSYMVPSAFVLLPALPLNAHGKVDRRALPEPDLLEERDFTAPRTPTEERLAALWAEILGVERIGVHESFFAAGGHSLRAVQLVSRLRQAFGVDLGVHVLFSAPTIAELAEAIQRARGEEIRHALPPIRPVPRGGLLPVSFPQQRLWFVERLAPDRATYNIPMSYRLRGRLYAAALEAALGEVVRRHETLRTRFVEVDGQPWQEILPPAPFVLPVIDLSGLPEEPRQRELARIGRAEAGGPFDLAAALMRSRLIKLGEREHAFLVTLHHIAFDGWSEEVMRRELSTLYAAALTGQPAHLPEMRIQYADFAAWQRSWPAGVLAEQLAYWSRRLGGVATLEIPTDRPRPPVQTFRGGVEPFAIGAATGAALRALAEERGVTLFMLLLAAWQTLLHRISGQADVAVGSPVANRTRSEIEGLIGFFVNMLAFRTDFGGDPSFADLLGRMRQTALEAYDHADVPFERLVDELRLERDLSRNPVVQVMFALQNAGVEDLRLPRVTLERLDFTVPVAKFDLTLWLREESGGDFSGWVEYNADLFDRASMARLAGHLGSVLAAVTARPADPVSRIDLLTPHERRQILEEWNDTRTDFPESTLIHQFFEAQVDRAPAALASVWQDRSVTYGELEARANRLAHLLRGRGLERGAAVGVWMERSIDMLAGVLGVLKAGGYYLPLDPAWPAERVESILGTCAAPAILTRSAHLGPVLEMQWRLPALAEVICLDVETPEPAPEPVDAGSISAVFDLVAEAAVDRVTAGGFVSSYTGERFSEAEVDEYRDRVLALAAPWIGPDRRVLEIGSGSGLILWEIAPRVARCVGLDASALTQARNRERAAELGLGNVELPVGFAHEIAGWPEGSFDLVILASTVQFFPGPLYLERIVSQALRLLAPGGGLVIADVPDARRQEELRRTVEEQRALRGLPARHEATKILSVDEDLFRDLAALPGAGEVSVRHRETGFANELGFRYDVVLTRGEARAGRRKRLWTSWHVEEQPAERPPAVASPEDLAYIIHTSGSTGQPKGIAVQHRPVANLFAWLNPAFGIGPEDRVLFVTSLCFDLSVYDIFGLLAAGGCVHVASEEDLRDAERLTWMLVEEPITLWDSAPAALVRLAPLFPAEPAAHSRLRRVMLSGDWIPVTLPDRVRAAFPHAVVTSLGGATEATVWSNWYPIREVDPSWPSIPYGRPIDNARYHVLDAGLNPCPIGVPGDLYIGGEVLCVGYSHQPAVTAAAFVPDPFGGAPGARIYRTGDRARWFADGNLEFLGRVDQQVKIRGFRIELGEIEVALARHPELREAVVLAREDVPGDKRLVAYVVPVAGAAAPSAIELREFLRHGLPDYMIPAAFVELDHLPVTANGKLDRRALPAPRWDHAAAEGEADLPATATEQALAGLWREILGVESVNRNDDFFDLGGHSLLATQLVARLREVFGAEVPLRVVFQSPSLAELAAEIDALVAELGDAPAPAGPLIQPVPRTGELPLSASQLRQWFLVQLEGESAAYNLPVTVKLDGGLRVDVLAAALDEIVRRHEALRTTFAAAGGRPYVVIAPRLELPLPVADLAGLPEAEREAEARRLAGEDLDRPFDLVHGPLLRTTLIRLAAAEHVLAVTFHHIVFDGSSLGVFLRELAALYEAFAAGRPSPLPELPVQYVDYAAWQRDWMAGPGLAGQLDYWKRQLAGASRVLDLPTDRPRPAAQSHRGRLMRLETPPSLASGLKTLTSREGVTLFMTVLASYATVLGRYTGQEDLNIGSFVANRRHEVLERLIGFFVNTLVLRADLSGDPTFRELLARTREMTLDAFERQELPFEQLLDELQIERDPSRTPLFQAMFGVQNFAIPSIRVPGLSLETIGLTDKERTTTDLSLYMWEEEGVMTSWMEFSTDLFDASTMERLFGHIGTLLAAAEADPGRRLSDLPLMSDEETGQVLGWSAGGERRGTVRPVHERMREQARRTPAAPAVVAGGEVLTYGELDRRAGRVARGLRRLGVGPETVVGLCVDRSPEMIVALYGILGAGAAYLPLDPGLPADRLVLLTGAAGVPLVLTRKDLAGALPELPARLLRVDADFESESGDGLPEIETALESAAYVLYTSGSTGTPKGVVVEHRALGSFVQAAIETYGFHPGDRVLQFANLAFDTSAEEIYPCLAVGGALVLRDEEMLASPARFLAACADAGITVLDLPTAWWHELSAWVEKERPALPAGLRLIILGGERALPERVRGWLATTAKEAGGGPRLFNSYGPTEGTVVATACDLGETAPAVPIGRPLPGVEVYTLDPGLRPAPAGVPGEICLGGADLARGYLGRPDLTAERFVPSPFGPAGARLYRTGDLGRWRPDGQLDFAGRVDDQVKIRGFRIEPGEVAAVLARHPGIQEAVVVAHEVRPGERELTAYAVPLREPWPELAELRAFLKESLPAYMIPSGLVLLGAMPRTATGKVDRRALPAPDRAARHDREYAAPETPSEELIAGIWQELLGVEPVGIYDNFFDLGGHSLLAPQVISRVGETFEIELPLRILFEAPTVAQMANAVEQILLAQIEELSDEEVAGLVGGEP